MCKCVYLWSITDQTHGNMEFIHYVDTMNFGQVINEQQLKENSWGGVAFPLCAPAG